MNTQKFDNNETEKKVNNTGAKIGAAVAGAAVAGAAAGAVGAGIVESAEETVDSPSTHAEASSVNEPETQTQEQSSSEEQPTPSPTEVNTTPEPSPIPGVEPLSEPAPIVPEPEPEPVPESEPEPEPEPEPSDLIGIIAPVEQIDPDDINMANVVNVDDLGTVYTMNGEMLAAGVHDESGNEMLMVDLDGDQVFDVLATNEGQIIQPVDDKINVSDAEHMMTADDPGYLASNDFDDNMDSASEIQNDIIDA